MANSKNKILAVDDNPVNIAIMEELLNADYDLAVANDGETALKLADELRPDIILLDIMMPGMDGYEVCQRIRKSEELKYTKILMVSAKNVISDKLQGYKAGADDYITKPFDASELLAKIKVYLRLKAIEELDDIKNELSMSVTHELRTPLCISRNIISNMQAGVYGQFEPKASGQIDLLKENIDRLARIINNFMHTSKLDAGKSTVKSTYVDICELVNEACETTKNAYLSKNIEFMQEAIDNIPTIKADRDKILHIIMELINNSVNYNEKDICKINITISGSQEEVKIDINDNGPGIEVNSIDKIFDKFVQVRRNVGPGEHGVGLGLSIVKGLVELHNGTIEAQNNDGDGAKFSITLPKSEKTNVSAEEIAVTSMV